MATKRDLERFAADVETERIAYEWHLKDTARALWALTKEYAVISSNTFKTYAIGIWSIGYCSYRLFKLWLTT